MNLFEEGLREVVAQAVNGETHHCVTIEGRTDDSKWVQLTWDSINMAYPREVAPAQTLESAGIDLPEALAIEDWKSGLYLTFEHSAEHFDVLGEFIANYFERVLDLPPSEMTLKVRRETL